MTFISKETASVPGRDAPSLLWPVHGHEIRQNAGPRFLKSQKKIIPLVVNICPHKCWGCPSFSAIFEEPDRHRLTFSSPHGTWYPPLCLPVVAEVPLTRTGRKPTPYNVPPTSLRVALTFPFSHSAYIWIPIYQKPRSTDSGKLEFQLHLFCFLMVNSMSYSFWITHCKTWVTAFLLLSCYTG